MLPAAAIVARCTLKRKRSGCDTSASAPPLLVPSATATTSVACLCAYTDGCQSSCAIGSCAWPCRAARPSPLHVIIMSQPSAPNPSSFRFGCSGCLATFQLRRSSAAERGTLSSVSCMAARRLRGLLAASRMERISRRLRVPDASSQYRRRSHSACRRRTPAMYTSSVKGFPVTAWCHPPSRQKCSASGRP